MPSSPDPSSPDPSDVPPPRGDFGHEQWQEDPTPPAWKQWLTGWRLLGTLAAAGTLFWFTVGPAAYGQLKEWRGRRALAASREAQARGAEDEARQLLTKAAVLAPADPDVIRAVVDWAKPRREIIAILALQRLIAMGAASADEPVELCRLALEWGHPELADRALLEEWAQAPALTLAHDPFLLGCRWLAANGKTADAAERLRLRMGAPGAPAADQPALRLALARILLERQDPATVEADWREAVRLLWELALADPAPALTRGEAAIALSGVLASQPVLRQFAGPGRMDTFQKGLERLASHGDLSAEARFDLVLARLALEAATGQLPRSAMVEKLRAALPDPPGRARFAGVRWLITHGLFDEALAWIAERKEPDDREWFTARCDALFALRRWDDLKALLAAEAKPPLSPVEAGVFRWRLASAASEPAETLLERRGAIEREAALSDGMDILKAAVNLERTGEPELASRLFRRLKDHEQAGLAARLGLVRCLNRLPDKSMELIEAIESLLVMRPGADDARNDAVYLKLLEGVAEEADRAAAEELAARRPQFLSCRSTQALARLRGGRPEEAIRAYDGVNMQWESVPPGWRAVRAAALAAAGRKDEARLLSSTIPRDVLRRGEVQLLKEFVDAPEAGGP
jgi:hypothetical protein